MLIYKPLTFLSFIFGANIIPDNDMRFIGNFDLMIFMLKYGSDVFLVFVFFFRNVEDKISNILC